MAGHRFCTLVYDAAGATTFTVAGGASAVVDIDLNDQLDAQFNVKATWDSTSGTTGTTMTAYYGMGGSDEDATGYQMPCVLGGASASIIFSTNGDSISTATATPTSSNVTATTFYSTNDLRTRNPRWLRLVITNTDASNPVTITIYGDI